MDNQYKFKDDIDKLNLNLIYNKYYKKMYAYGIAIGFCEHDCKDAVQDVFCTICHSEKKIKNVENIEVYLLQCMKNKLYDIYNDDKKRRCICYDNSINNFEQNLSDEIIAKENKLLMRNEIDRLLKKLSPKHRKIVVCRYDLNLNFNEIAAIMNMTPGAVKKQLYRSLKLMRQKSK